MSTETFGGSASSTGIPEGPGKRAQRNDLEKDKCAISVVYIYFVYYGNASRIACGYTGKCVLWVLVLAMAPHFGLRPFFGRAEVVVACAPVTRLSLICHTHPLYGTYDEVEGPSATVWRPLPRERAARGTRLPLLVFSAASWYERGEPIISRSIIIVSQKSAGEKILARAHSGGEVTSERDRFS